MISEFECFDDCPATGQPVLLGGYKLLAGTDSIRALSWCSNANRCVIEYGALSDIPSCLLHHLQVSCATKPASQAVIHDARHPDIWARMPLDVTIAPCIADLVPGFMSNRRQEALDLAAALESSDEAHIDHLSQRMIGVGSMYGFDGVTTLGKVMRDALRKGRKGQLKSAISLYGAYLAKVRVTYSSEQSVADRSVNPHPRTNAKDDEARSARRARVSTTRNVPTAVLPARAQA